MIDARARDRPPVARARGLRSRSPGALPPALLVGVAARHVHGNAARAAEARSVLVARAVRVPRSGARRRLHLQGRLSRVRPALTSARMAMLAAAGGRPHALRRSAHEPHLLRRADLPEHRPEPGGPEAGAGLQRRQRGVRPAAVRERRIQQAAVRLPAPAEPRLSAVRRARRDGVRGERRGDGARRSCAVYLLVWLLFRDRDAALFAGLVLALTPQQIIWSATAAVEPSASLAAVLALVCAAHYCDARGSGRAGRRRRRRRLRHSVPPGVAADAARSPACSRGRGFAASWSSRAAGGRACCSWGSWRCTSRTCSRSGTSTGARARRGSRSATFPANLRVNGWFYLYDERFPVALHRCSPLRRAVGRGHFAGSASSMALYFLLFFAHRSACSMPAATTTAPTSAIRS